MEKELLIKIWRCIQWHEPRDARDIAMEAGVGKPERTEETVRRAVAKFRDIGLPVASCREGFFKTTCPKRLAECAIDLQSRSSKMHSRSIGLLRRIQEGWSPAAYEEMFDQVFYES